MNTNTLVPLKKYRIAIVAGIAILALLLLYVFNITGTRGARREFLRSNQTTNHVTTAELARTFFLATRKHPERITACEPELYSHGNWRIFFFYPGIDPLMSGEALITNDGKLMYANDETAEIFLKTVYPSTLTSEEKDAAIALYRDLLEDDAVIIKSLTDIPEYEKKPFNDEQFKLFQEAIATTSTPNHVAFVIYQQIGGIVARYDFEFSTDNKLLKATRLHIATAIGNALYYQ